MNGNWLTIGFVAGLMQCALASPAVSQEAKTFTETFNGMAPEIMLNGAIDVGPSGSWSVDVKDGSLVFANLKEPDAVRYVAVPWIIFPGRSSPERTDNANASVLLTAHGAGRAGAGILAGPDAGTGDYYIFSVGENGLYRVLQKTRGKVTTFAAGTNASIKSAVPNRLELERVKDRFSFRVNGTTIIEAPYGKLESAPVGLAVFGLGRFEFDEIRYTTNRETPPAYGSPP